MIGYAIENDDDEQLTPYDVDPEAIGFDTISGEFLWGNGDQRLGALRRGDPESAH